jgi:predicted RNase H-like HicB family nuclease
MRFQVVFTFDEGYGGYFADAPELPGCISQGKTIEEATENVREAIQGYLEVLAERGEPYVPESRFILVGEVAV